MVKMITHFIRGIIVLHYPQIQHHIRSGEVFPICNKYCFEQNPTKIISVNYNIF